MANWCFNSFTLYWDEDHRQAPELVAKIEAYQRLYRYCNTQLHEGVWFNKEKNDALHSLDMENNGRGNVGGQFESKWGPPCVESIEKLLLRFPCITSLELEYDEPGNQYAGIIDASREFDEIVVVNTPVRDLYWVLISMRDMSFGAPYASIEDCIERTGCTKKEVEQVINSSRIALEDFTSDMEIFDIEEYVR